MSVMEPKNNDWCHHCLVYSNAFQTGVVALYSASMYNFLKELRVLALLRLLQIFLFRIEILFTCDPKLYQTELDSLASIPENTSLHTHIHTVYTTTPTEH